MARKNTKSQRILCDRPGCHYRDQGTDERGHRSQYHSFYHDIEYQGIKRRVERGLDGKIPCPCGDPSHSRHNFQFVRKICKHHTEKTARKWQDRRSSYSDINKKLLISCNIDFEDDFDEEETEDTDQIWEGYEVQLAGDEEEPEEEDVTFTREEEYGQDVGRQSLQIRSQTDFNEAVEEQGIEMADGEVGDDVEEGAGCLMGVENAGPSDNAADVDINECFGADDVVLSDEEGETEEEEEQADELLPHKTFLGEYDLKVEPRFRLTICVDCKKVILPNQAFGHLRLQHAIKTRRPDDPFRPPLNSSIEDSIRALGGFDPLPIPTASPIPYIPGVKYDYGYRCPVQNCWKIYDQHRYFNRHWSEAHPKRNRPAPHQRRKVPYQVTCYFRGDTRFTKFAVLLPTNSSPITTQKSLAFETVMSRHKPRNSDPPEAEPRDSTRDRIMQETGWQRRLNNVSPRRLRRTIQPPTTAAEKHLEMLKGGVRAYYVSTRNALAGDGIEVETMKYLHSGTKGKSHSRAFNRLQHLETVHKYSDRITQFLLLLVRSRHAEVPGHSIHLHPKTASYVDSLEETLKKHNPSKEEIGEHVHLVMWSLMKNKSAQAESDSLMCPVVSLLLATHLDNDGALPHPEKISQHLAALQWCLRVTAAKKIMNLKGKREISCFEAYELIEDYVIRNKRTLFGRVKKYLDIFQNLSTTENSVPTIDISRDGGVIRVGQHAFRVQNFIDSIRVELTTTTEKLRIACREFPQFDQLLNDITHRLNLPSDHDLWIFDDPKQTGKGHSFLKQESNGMHEHRDLLLAWICSRPEFFHQIDTHEVTPRVNNIRKWIREVDDIMKSLLYLVYCTSGGCARGTEMENIRYANLSEHTSRDAFIHNGILVIVTPYNKTQSATGTKKVIARAPAVGVSKLLIFILWQVYRACHKLFSFIANSPEDRVRADRYRYELFVFSGETMTSTMVSDILRHFTGHYVDKKLGLADFRQVMSYLLLKKTDTFFEETEDSDRVAATHQHFGHSLAMGKKHYAVDAATSKRRLTPDDFLRMLRISFSWQSSIGLLPDALRTRLRTHDVDCEMVDQLADQVTLRLSEQLKPQILETTSQLVTRVVEEASQQVAHQAIPQLVQMLSQQLPQSIIQAFQSSISPRASTQSTQGRSSQKRKAPPEEGSTVRAPPKRSISDPSATKIPRGERSR
ncbi:hypothetical protein AAF712_005687 [Marasmius tenuissimus]|uniref:C2H2-type domain-containing protein n=1 Tax=Marasmius tenuissimus TaxID=585030 RepID=A0ABR3A1U6_9AGAR